MQARREAHRSYLNLPVWQKTALPIVVVNTAVFAAWLAAPRLRISAFMQRNFVHRPCSPRVYTMLTSVYSHQVPLHFLFNNLALWSVGGGALASAAFLHGRAPATLEASQTPHFLAFFATAGTFAALVSHLGSAVRWRSLAAQFRRLARADKGASAGRPAQGAALNRVRLALTRLARSGSLGSSGAIYAAFVLSAFAYPSASLRCAARVARRLTAACCFYLR